MDALLYQDELNKIFYAAHWCSGGLDIEIPNTGDYKLSHVGERQVLMVRDRVALKDKATDPGIRVVENRCAHRGVLYGFVFATFGDSAPPLEDYLGPNIMPWVNRIFKGDGGARHVHNVGR